MPKKKSRTREIARTARDYLGFASLRPGQEEAVAAILDGHDTLVVQPTASGKSAIYQIAGPCGNCDNCETATGQVRVDPTLGTRLEVI